MSNQRLSIFYLALSILWIKIKFIDCRLSYNLSKRNGQKIETSWQKLVITTSLNRCQQNLLQFFYQSSIMTKIQYTENGNDISCHPVNTVESQFFKPPTCTKTRIGQVNLFKKSRVKLMSDLVEGNNFWSQFQKTEYSQTSHKCLSEAVTY